LSQLLQTSFSADETASADASSFLRPDVVVVSFETSGGVDGTLAVLIDDGAARWLVGRLTGGGPAEGELGEVALAALAELGNIAASAFLNAAALLVRRSCLPSVPRVGTGPEQLGAATRSAVATVRAEGHPVRLVFAPRAA
jgi:chemotaxis protein CheY-P-specific phosphatase CheC